MLGALLEFIKRRRVELGVEVEKAIVEVLRRRGPMYVYQLAKALGLSYGAVQWYVVKLERMGVVKTIKVGNRRYVALGEASWEDVVRVRDVLEDFLRALAARGVDLDATLRQAFDKLDSRLADLLRELALGVVSRLGRYA